MKYKKNCETWTNFTKLLKNDTKFVGSNAKFAKLDKYRAKAAKLFENTANITKLNKNRVKYLENCRT